MPSRASLYCLQLLRYDQGGLVERFLLDAASRSVYFAHMLVCQLLSEGTPPEEAFNPTVSRGVCMCLEGSKGQGSRVKELLPTYGPAPSVAAA